MAKNNGYKEMIMNTQKDISTTLKELKKLNHKQIEQHIASEERMKTLYNLFNKYWYLFGMVLIGVFAIIGIKLRLPI